MSVQEIIRTHSKNDTFKYQLLSRMKQDCEYYLGYGNRSEKVLWSGTVKEHIADMKELHNSFDDRFKPEWLTMEDIEEYERKMKA